MAVGDIAYDTDPVGTEGSLRTLNGTIEVSDVYTAFALLSTKSRLVHVHLQDEDGAGAYELDLNVNAAGTATNGTIAVAGNHVTVNTVRFRALYR